MSTTEPVAGYRRDPQGLHPPLDYPDYRSTDLRAPREPLVYLPHGMSEITAPRLGDARRQGELDHDLTCQHDGEPVGERIIVQGRILDGNGRPIPDTLVEIRQANAADPVLSSVPAERRETLVARPDGDNLRFDIRLQGRGETAFFDV